MQSNAKSNYITKSMRVLFFVFFALILVSTYPAPPLFADDDPSAVEVKIGTDEAKKFDADSKTKFIKDPEIIKRIETIGNTIAEVANRKKVTATYGKSDVYKFKYTFKVVDDKDVNAFSLPGGFVYVNKGLIDYAQSDDEIAGVIGHEMGHIAHHHSIQLLATQNKQMLGMVGVMLAGALGHVKGDVLSDVYIVGSLANTARLSGYGQKAEYDADHMGVEYLSETKYNPVGILTLMQRLAMDELRKPDVNYGIYASHPQSRERADEIIKEIQALGLTINSRLVTNYLKVQIKPVDKTSNSSVWIAKTEIVRLADSGGKTSAARAGIFADILRSKLNEGAQRHDVKIDADTNAVSITGDDVFTPTAEDAALSATTPGKLSKAVADNIKNALMDEILQRGF